MNQFFSFLLKNSIAGLLGVCLLWQYSPAQETAPKIEWQKSLGGGDWDIANSIAQTSDGGYIVAGWSSSNDGDVSGNHGEGDYWIVKLTSGGELAWQKSLGGSDKDIANSIAQADDGGYVVAGWSQSTNGDVTGNHGLSDAWIVKLTSEGELVWQKSLGANGWDEANSIQQTSDGGYIVAGSSLSTDGDVTGHHGSVDSTDSWIVKLTSGGELAWQKSLGGKHHDRTDSIAQISDGEYIIAGLSSSKDGDASSIAQTADGGYIVAGVSYSNDGNATGNHIAIHYTDFWIVKLAPSNSTGR